MLAGSRLLGEFRSSKGSGECEKLVFDSELLPAVETAGKKEIHADGVPCSRKIVRFAEMFLRNETIGLAPARVMLGRWKKRPRLKGAFGESVPVADISLQTGGQRGNIARSAINNRNSFQTLRTS